MSGDGGTVHVAILGMVVRKPLTDEVALEQKPKGSERTNRMQISRVFQLEGIASTNIGKFEEQQEAQGQY